MACKNHNQLPPDINWRKVDPLSDDIYPHDERAFFSLACNHCEHPACMAHCPADAYAKRDKDGVVIHDQDKCIGCRTCLRSCPFGAPRFDERLQRAEKCSLCWERLDAGLDPACVQSCPADALKLIDLADFDVPETVQTPLGFPNKPQLNPSTRFRLPTLPKITSKNCLPKALKRRASLRKPAK
ncbi:DMSO reductase [Rhodoblastus sphagnicola]|uniref:DMSO reductase n=2 Tax=Rhodoblastus sphagnicola TaxID=333368 RepID=A0A2S6N973_9HYPH|nr:DMSO reductase [Rhodoblastus sphagnicola]